MKARLGAFHYLSDNGWFEEGTALELPNQDSVLKIMNAGGYSDCVCECTCVCGNIGDLS